MEAITKNGNIFNVSFDETQKGKYYLDRPACYITINNKLYKSFLGVVNDGQEVVFVSSEMALALGNAKFRGYVIKCSWKADWEEFNKNIIRFSFGRCKENEINVHPYPFKAHLTKEQKKYTDPFVVDDEMAEDNDDFEGVTVGTWYSAADLKALKNAGYDIIIYSEGVIKKLTNELLDRYLAAYKTVTERNEKIFN